MFPQSHIAFRLCAPGLSVCLSTLAAVLLWGKIITHSYRMQTVKYCLDCWFPPTSRHESTNTYCRMLIWCVWTVQINASVVRRNAQCQHLGSTYKPVATQNGPLSKPQKDQEQRERKRQENATQWKSFGHGSIWKTEEDFQQTQHLCLILRSLNISSTVRTKEATSIRCKTSLRNSSKSSSLCST